MTSEERGEQEYAALIGHPAALAVGDVRAMSPEMFDTMIAHAFGGALSNGDLDRAARELATVAILATLGDSERQLATHTGAALRQAISAAELRALCEHVSVYAGFPRALNALRAIDESLADAGVPRPPALRSVRLRDRETVVASVGTTGPPVVLVHALGLDWRMWEQVMATLANGWRVFAYDLRGHGRAAGARSSFTMDEIAADLIAILDALELDRAHVVGLSYGGGIAQTAAVNNPERFLSLSLLATTDYPFDAFEARARSGEVDGMEAQVVPSLTRWFNPEELATNPWPVRYARERVRRGNPTDWAAAWRAFKGLDVQGRLATFAAPTLVLAGANDASTTPEIMRGIAVRIPGSTYAELENAPHMQTLSMPAAVAAELTDFLSTTATQ